MFQAGGQAAVGSRLSKGSCHRPPESKAYIPTMLAAAGSAEAPSLGYLPVNIIFNKLRFTSTIWLQFPPSCIKARHLSRLVAFGIEDL